MIKNIEKIRPYSTNLYQDFMWVAEYINGKVENEFQSNGFNIDRTKLLNFGLTGNGVIAYYDVAAGNFHFQGKSIGFAIITDDNEEYNLTNQFKLYNDCIGFHNYFSDMSPLGDKCGGDTLCGFAFGYKTKLEIKNTIFSFQPVFTIDYGRPFVIKNKIVSNKSLKGKFVIKIDGIIVDHRDIELQAYKNKKIEWVVRV